MLWLRSAGYALLLPCSVLLWVPLWLSTGHHADLGVGPLRWIGLPLVVLGATGLLWCIADFARRGRRHRSPVRRPL